jgi:hypothetical protein
MGTVTIKEMLQEMNSGRVFSISFVSYDKQRRRGGEVKEYPSAVLLRTDNDTIKPKNDNKKGSVGSSTPPKHYEHATRAFRVVLNGVETSAIKKFHLFLVLQFNGKKLVL